MSNKKDLPVLTDKQELGRRILMEDNHYTDIMFDGGSRSGKTYLICTVLLLYMMYYPGIRILAARMKFAHARASLWEQTLLPLLRSMGITADINRTLYTIRIGKSELWLGGLDNKEKTEKVLGQEFAIIYLNEAVEIPESIRDLVKTRLAQNVGAFLNFMVYDCNPRQPTHYLYKEFYLDNDKDRKVLKFLPRDNEENLPKGYIENTLNKLPQEKRARFLEGQWAYSPGAVYSNILETHIIKCDRDLYKSDYDDFTIGVDWGLYTCASIWGIKRDSGKLQAYCIHEIIILDGITEDLIKEFNKIFGIKEKGIILYCDHEPDRIQKLNSSGYNAVKAYKDVGPGDDSVNSYELWFHVLCKYTFQSMVNLRNKKDPSGKGFLYGNHVKEGDHEADGGRYALHGWKMDNMTSEGSHFILERSII